MFRIIPFLLCALALILPAGQLRADTSFFDHLRAPDLHRWNAVSDTAPADAVGTPLLNSWDSSQVTFSRGRLITTLKAASGQAVPYISGEYSSIATYGYGCYSVQVRPASASGIISSFALEDSGTDGGPLVRVSFDVLGADPHLVRTSVRPFQINGDQTVARPDDLSHAFHTLGIKWSAESVEWYLDGQLLRSMPVDGTNGAPSLPPNGAHISLSVAALASTGFHGNAYGILHYTAPISTEWHNFRFVDGGDCTMGSPLR